MPSPLRSRVARSSLLALSLALSACATARIPNTDVPDTRENQELIQFAERYRRAVEQRDVRALIAMAAPNYFEDGGTPMGDDDYGIDGLRRLLSTWAESVREIRYECRYHRINLSEDGSRATIDYTFTGSFTLVRPPVQVPDGMLPPAESIMRTDPARAEQSNRDSRESWHRRVADNRLELQRIDGQWRIVAGM